MPVRFSRMQLKWHLRGKLAADINAETEEVLFDLWASLTKTGDAVFATGGGAGQSVDGDGTR